MIAFADSSALVKRYISEEHGNLVSSPTAIVASSLASVEVCSAIWRRARLGGIEPADAALLAGRARWDLTGGDPLVVVVPPTTPVLVDAAQLTGTAGLRAYDAVQLATARAMRGTDPAWNRFACFDRTLAAAAAADGFELITA